MFALPWDAIPANSIDQLDAMLASVPASERAYAARSADADARLKQWEAELEAWEWPEDHDGELAYQGFLVPDEEERAVKRRKLSRYGIHAEQEEEFWGCVPAKLARHYTERLDAIQTHMDELDLENLKAFVLNAHASKFEGTTYRPLSDSTALITGVILEFLPRVSRVVALINAWEVRLAVLCRTGTYLRALKKAEVCLKTGWEIVDELHACRKAELAAARNGKEIDTSLKSELAALVPKMAGELSERISQCAQLIDNMLDGLEGRWERVPPEWIDRMDILEADYGHWTVLAGTAELGAEWPLETLKRAAAINESREHLELPPLEPVEEVTSKDTLDEPRRGSFNRMTSPTPSSTSRGSLRLSKRLSRNVSVIDGFMLPSSPSVVTAPPTPEMAATPLQESLSSSPVLASEPLVRSPVNGSSERSLTPEARPASIPKISEHAQQSSHDEQLPPEHSLPGYSEPHDIVMKSTNTGPTPRSNPSSPAEATDGDGVSLPQISDEVRSNVLQNGSQAPSKRANQTAVEEEASAHETPLTAPALPESSEDPREAALKALTERSAVSSPADDRLSNEPLTSAATAPAIEEQSSVPIFDSPSLLTPPADSLNRESVITILEASPILPMHLDQMDEGEDVAAPAVVDKPRLKAAPEPFTVAMSKTSRETDDGSAMDQHQPLVPQDVEQLSTVSSPRSVHDTTTHETTKKMLILPRPLLHTDGAAQDSPTVPDFVFDDEPSPLINAKHTSLDSWDEPDPNNHTLSRLLESINPAALSASNLANLPDEPTKTYPLPASMFEEVDTPEYTSPEITVQSPSLLDQLAQPQSRLELLVRDVLLGEESPENVSPVEKREKLEALAEEMRLRPDPLTQEDIVRPQSLMAFLEPSAALPNVPQSGKAHHSEVPLDDEATLPPQSLYDALTPGSETVIELRAPRPEQVDDLSSQDLKIESSVWQDSALLSNKPVSITTLNTESKVPSVAPVEVPIFSAAKATTESFLSGKKEIQPATSDENFTWRTAGVEPEEVVIPLKVTSKKRTNSILKEAGIPLAAAAVTLAPVIAKSETRSSASAETEIRTTAEPDAVKPDEPAEPSASSVPIAQSVETKSVDLPKDISVPIVLSKKQDVPVDEQPQVSNDAETASTGQPISQTEEQLEHSLDPTPSPEKLPKSPPRSLSLTEDQPATHNTQPEPQTPTASRPSLDNTAEPTSREYDSVSASVPRTEDRIENNSDFSPRPSDYYLKYNAFAAPQTPKHPPPEFEDEHDMFDVAEDVSPLLAKFPTPPRSDQKIVAGQQNFGRDGFPESPTLPVSWSNDTIEDLEQAALGSRSVDAVLAEQFFGGPILNQQDLAATVDEEILLEPVLPLSASKPAAVDFTPESADADHSSKYIDHERISIEVPVPEVLDLDYILAASIELPDDLDDYNEMIAQPAGGTDIHTPISKVVDNWPDSSPAGPRSPSPTPAEPKISVRKRGKAPATSEKRASMASNSTVEEILDQKITSLLTRMPGKMRWSRERGANAKPVPQPSTRSSSRASVTRPESRTSRPIRQPAESSVRVYRFHRQADEPPIRLFVRLVGENGERVMVRVGGGWSDLEAYLRAYAAHHGRRSTSEGKVEVQDVSLSASGRCMPVSSRPGSSMSFNSRRVDSSPLEMRTPAPVTPLNLRPGVTPPSRHGEGDSMLGLAGPRSRLVEMSPEDEAWVEGVKGQVRRASAQRRDEQRGSAKASPIDMPPVKDLDFGELSKVGGTRRLFVKKS